MNDLRKAAEMALEALEDIFGKEKKDVGAINALRQALEQPDEVLAEREACAMVCDDMFYRTSPDTDYAEATEDCAKEIRARGENPPVKTYAGGKPNYCTPEHDVPQP